MKQVFKKLGIGIALASTLVVFTKCAFMRSPQGQSVIHLTEDACVELTAQDTSQAGQVVSTICATAQELDPLVDLLLTKRALKAGDADAGPIPEQ